MTPAITENPWQGLICKVKLLMSLTPVIHIHSQISLWIFKKIWNEPIGILRDWGDTDSWKNLKLKVLCQTLLTNIIYLKSFEPFLTNINISPTVFGNSKSLLTCWVIITTDIGSTIIQCVFTWCIIAGRQHT
jgi:hypothetical protein